MKKSLRRMMSAILAIVMLLSFSAVGYAADGASVTISSDGTVIAGEEETFTVGISNNPGIAGFTLEYVIKNADDHDVTNLFERALDADDEWTWTDSLLQNSKGIPVGTYTSDGYNLNWNYTKNIEGDGSLCIFNLVAKTEILNGTYKIVLQKSNGFDKNFCNADGQPVSVTFVEHEFTVTGGIDPATLSPAITGQPASASYTYGQEAAALKVTASAPAGAALSYQWYSNTANSTAGGTAIEGATNNTYTPGLSAFGTAYYYCVVTNTFDGQTYTATSNVAAVTYSKADQAALSLTNSNTVAYGDTLTLTTAGGTGDGAVTYSVKNGTGSASVTGSTLTPASTGTVTVTATKAGGDNYNDATAEQTVTVTPAELTLNGAASYQVSVYTSKKPVALPVPAVTAKGDQTVTSDWSITGGADKITLENGAVTATDSARKGDTAAVTLTYSAPNHSDKTVTYTITVLDKNDVSDQMTFRAKDGVGTVTYDGTAKSVNTFVNAAAIADGYTGGITYTVTDSDGKTAAAGADLNALTVTNAGTYTVTAVYSDDENEGAKELTFTIDRATIDVSGWGWNYSEPFTYNGTAQSVSLADSDEKVDVAYSGNSAADAGSYTAVANLTVKAAYQQNYKLSAAQLTQEWKINQKTIDVTGASWSYTAPFTYDGQEKTVTVTGVNTDEVNINYSDNAKTNAGTYSASAAFSAVDSKNCTVTGAIDALEWTVNKAQAPALSPQTVSLRYSNTDAQTFTADTIKTLVGDSNEDTTITITGVSADSNDVLDSPAYTDSNVTYALKSGLTADAAGETATVTVSFSSNNYESSTVELTVTVINKNDISDRITFENGSAVYTGEAQTYEKATVPGELTGTITYTYSSADVTNVGTYTVTATYEDNDNFGTKQATFTITKATPTGKPAFDKINTTGKTLADVNLTVGTITPADGTIQWVDEDGSELPDDTEVVANKAYTWAYTPTDTENYNVLTGTITPYAYTPYVPAPTSYAITVSDTENGTVSLSASSAVSGATVTITAAPDEGYQVDTVEVRDSKDELVAVTDNGDGTFTFVMPASKVSVSAAFTEIKQEPAETPEQLPFTDVADNAWYADAVRYVYGNELMNGVTVTAFEPETTTSRGMLVTILYRLEGEPAVGQAAFTDVADGQWYTDAVAWAAANNIVNGYGDGTFGPNDPITREQMAAILYRYAAYKGYDVTAQADLSGYTDADQISGYALEAMRWANAEGLITGVTATTLVPGDDSSRAVMATILMRFIENLEK